MYNNGQGVPKDFTKAAEWFRKSANQGNAEGQKNLRIAEEELKKQPKPSAENEQNNQGEPIISTVIVLLVIVGIIYLVIFGSSGKISDTGSMICQNCGTRGEPKTITKGSIWIEIILWLCLIVPGLIYSIWRLTTRQKGCPSCGQVSMIPVNTPIGRTLVEKLLVQSGSSSTNMA
jgi:Sel1 repeat